MANYNRQDALYYKAKDEGLRSRAAYKLVELDEKYKLLKTGMRVLDLGAWPGGWLQVAAKKIGPSGLVVGIDLQQFEDFPEANIEAFSGDIREIANLERALEFAKSKFDLVLSDMSPKLSGIKEADRAGSVACAELALESAKLTLKTGGAFVCKVFKSNEAEQFLRESRPMFEKLTRAELKSTRKTSDEYYLVGLGFKETNAN